MEQQHQPTRARVRVRVRLTPRGRLVALAFLVLLAFAVLTSVSALRAATQAGTGWPASPTRYVTVQPGQTLWQIALRVAPSDDPRDTVDRIRSLNGIGGTTVQVGQRLVVPA
jgi:predicted Zn-dependent protease